MSSYRAPAQRGETELFERGSRFIGVCVPAGDEDECKAFLAAERRRFPDATHHVYAYRLRSGAARFSDDGEPAGTAGSPVYEALNRRDLFNAAVIVTRYFGGTLLGAGGLVRAYSKAASTAADAAGSAVVRLFRDGTVTFPYSLYDRAFRLLREFEARDVMPEFAADVTVRFQLPEECWNGLKEALTDLTAGRCHFV